MALKRRSKTTFSQPGIDSSLKYEMYTDVTADDIVAFMAQAEATRIHDLRRIGIRRDTQTPSDELKSYLVRSLEE